MDVWMSLHSIVPLSSQLPLSHWHGCDQKYAVLFSVHKVLLGVFQNRLEHSAFAHAKLRSILGRVNDRYQQSLMLELCPTEPVGTSMLKLIQDTPALFTNCSCR